MKTNRFEPSPSMEPEMALLAQQYRAAEAMQDATQKELASAAYIEALQRHRASGWNGALGESLEIPDTELPAAYVERRNEVIQLLLDELDELAGRYRAFIFQTDQDDAIAQYHEVYDELCRIGHWSRIPHPYSQLDIDDMPASFQRFVEEGMQKNLTSNEYFSTFT